MDTKDEVLQAIANDSEIITLLQQKNFPDLTSFPHFDDALCYVAENGYTEIARLFLKHKTIDNPHFYALPLTLAAKNDHMDIVKFFLFEAKQPSRSEGRIKFEQDKTAIHPFLWAIENDFINVVKLYLDRYSKEYELTHETVGNYLSIFQQGYLLAIQEQREDIVSLLLDDEHIKPDKGYRVPPLVIAVMTGNLSLLNLLLQDDRFHDYDEAIKKACELGNLEMYLLLEKYEALARKKTEIYTSCENIEGLKLAIVNKRLSIILHFLKKPNIPLEHVFFWSVENNLIDIVELLLPQIDPQFDKSICLRTAAKLGHTEIVASLLKNGRSKPETFANQALRKATEHRHTAIVKMLLEDQRVNPSALENYALFEATKNGNSEIVKLILPRVDVKMCGYETISSAWSVTSWSVLKVYINDKRLNLELETLPDVCYQAYKKYPPYLQRMDSLYTYINVCSWLPWSKKVVNTMVNMSHDRIDVSEIRTKIKVAKLLNTCGLFRLAESGLVPDNHGLIKNFMLATLNKDLDQEIQNQQNIPGFGK